MKVSGHRDDIVEPGSIPKRRATDWIALAWQAGRAPYNSRMDATLYFVEQVMRKRPYLTAELCREVLAAPLRTQIQSDGRIRHWGRVTLPGEDKTRILRVITLDDGITLHNAFLDRGESSR